MSPATRSSHQSGVTTQLRRSVRLGSRSLTWRRAHRILVGTAICLASCSTPLPPTSALETARQYLRDAAGPESRASTQRWVADRATNRARHPAGAWDYEAGQTVQVRHTWRFDVPPADPSLHFTPDESASSGGPGATSPSTAEARVVVSAGVGLPRIESGVLGLYRTDSPLAAARTFARAIRVKNSDALLSVTPDAFRDLSARDAQRLLEEGPLSALDTDWLRAVERADQSQLVTAPDGSATLTVGSKYILLHLDRDRWAVEDIRPWR